MCPFTNFEGCKYKKLENVGFRPQLPTPKEVLYVLLCKPQESLVIDELLFVNLTWYHHTYTVFTI